MGGGTVGGEQKGNNEWIVKNMYNQIKNVLALGKSIKPFLN